MRIKLLFENNEYNISATGKETVLELIQKSDAEIIAPCGGMRKCGKCLVRVENTMQEMSREEEKLLGVRNLEAGYRLACFMQPEDGMTVDIPLQSARNKILTSSNLEMDSFWPAVGIKRIKTEIPHLDRQVSDIGNILKNSGMKIDKNNLPLLKELTEAISSSMNSPTLISYYDTIKGIEYKENGSFYGIAVDIGTTTVAVYLYNLENGEFTGVVSELNDQKQYGADVISRINYASTEKNGLETLNRLIIRQLNELTGKLCSGNGIRKEDIYMATIVGNTTMMHLLMGLDPVNIGKLPFIPVSTEMHDFPAAELGLEINKFGHALCLPSVSAYIGADIIAGLLACRLHERDEISLLVDIGTNGEMVLGSVDRMVSCSTAAGPAFEGANIRFGTGGISGAIDSVSISEGKLVFTTIDDVEPVGICGSGIVDAVAVMLDNDIIDETGRFYDEDEIKSGNILGGRIFVFEGLKAFKLTEYICITQKDIREIQNAKAALAAGISTLIKKYHINSTDVAKIYLAGGFGNYINVDSAMRIGLLPNLPKDKVIASGNTAGAGASMCLLSQKYIDLAEILKRRVEYVELTTDPGFTNEYIDNMIF
ncbi:MAG: ASKHA domain-containing protein [Clostridia bacterium]